MSATRMPSEPLSPEEERRVRATWADFLAAIDPDHHPIGVVPRLLATLDRDRDTLDSLTAERRALREALTGIDLIVQSAAYHRKFKDALIEVQELARAALSEGGSK